MSSHRPSVDEVRKAHRLYDGRRALLDYPPLWVTIGITGHCGFRCLFCCSHCEASKNDTVTSHQYKVPYTITIEDYRRAVDMCLTAGVPHVHICGMGEPFLHPRILDIIDYTIDAYGHTSLQTDFWQPLFEKRNFTEEIIRRKEAIDYITVDMFHPSRHGAIKLGSDFDYLTSCLARISSETAIRISAHVIVTKMSFQGVSELPSILSTRGVRCHIDAVNLFPLGFNDFTAESNVHSSADSDIAAELGRLQNCAERLGYSVRIAPAWDRANDKKAACRVFWEKVQLMPTKRLPESRWVGNAIPQQCAAAVRGNLFSIGNLFDHQSFMDFWNNEKLVAIRQRIVDGQLPDPECVLCPIGQHGRFARSRRMVSPIRACRELASSYLTRLRN